MDYMHLGVRSRKTGINARQGLEKDEYSMERIDDFFSEDSTSQVSSNRWKSRRTSMLSLLSSGGPNASNGSDFDRIQPSSPSTRTSRSYRFSLPENETLQEEEEEEDRITIGYESPAQKEQRTPHEEAEQPLVEPSIRLTPDRPSKEDVPDLIEDDEDTRDYTSFNTSENALLEDEMDDDYEVISEEDRDYVEGESSLEQSSSDDSDDSDNSDDDDSNSSGGGDTSVAQSEEEEEEDLATISSRQSLGSHAMSSEIYNSDKAYVERQPESHASGLRKSNRIKIAPLEWWRNEKVVYRRKSNKPILEIDKIITYDKNDEDDEDDEQSTGRRRRGNKQKGSIITRTRPYNYIPTGRPRGRPRKHKTMSSIRDPNMNLLEEINQGKIPQGEWLQHGILEANVNVTMDKRDDKIIAFAPNLSQSEQIRDTGDEQFSLAVMFDAHKEHFASGVLKIPLSGRKKLSDSYNVFITFFVIQGIVEVTLGGNTFITTEGSSFQIPAFNEYELENKGNNEVKMFFTQVTVSIDELQNDDISSHENNDENMESQSPDAGIDVDRNYDLSEDVYTKIRDRDITSEKRNSLSSMSISEI